IAERAIPVVMEQEAVGWFEDARDAIVMAAELVVAAGELARVIDEAADEQVQATVVVVIEPHGARSPARQAQTGFRGHISECAVAVVVIKNATTVGGDEEVGVTVVVVIAHGYAHPEGGPGADAGFLGDIGERAVAIVLVERVTKWFRGLEEIRRAAVYQVQIHPSVVVVVEERATGAESFRQVALGRNGVFVDPGDAARSRGYLLKNEPVNTWGG